MTDKKDGFPVMVERQEVIDRDAGLELLFDFLHFAAEELDDDGPRFHDVILVERKHGRLVAEIVTREQQGKLIAAYYKARTGEGK